MFSFIAIFFVYSCNEKQLTANKNKKATNFPSRIIYNANIIDRDSGFVKMRFRAPIIEEYELIDTPYVVAKKGINIDFFDKNKPKTHGNLKADYAKFIEKKDFYEALGNVKIINPDGQTFAMKSIYWDKKNRKMYTKDTVFITDKNGNILIAANGMKAKDDFSEYTLLNNSGSFNSKKIPNTGK